MKQTDSGTTIRNTNCEAELFTMSGTHRRATVALFLVYLLGSLILIFQLPYSVHSAPSVSDSYLFGYNNRAGIALLLLLAVVGVLLTRGLGLQLPMTSSTSRPVSRRVLILSLLAVLLGCVGMLLIVGRLGGFGESSYEIDRIWLTSIGRRPYFDFEWPFGAGLIYGPLALHRWFALTIPQSDYLFWIGNCLLGVWLLWATINAVNFPSERKTSVFLLLLVAWFPAIMNTGTHYTLTRYVLPLFFIVIVQAQIRRGTPPAYLFAALQILIVTTVLLLYSPEVAIAFALTTVGLFPLLAEKQNRKFLGAWMPLIGGLAALFFIARRLRILDTVMASGSGADSFPILPSPHILLFFAVFFLCLCFAYRRVATGNVNDTSIGLIAFAVPMLPAALGRCDPGHVLLNELGVFIVALLYLSLRNRFWKYTRVTFILVFIVLAQVGGLWLYAPILAKCSLRDVAGNNNGHYISSSLLSAGDFYINHFAPSNVKQRWLNHLQVLLREPETVHGGLPPAFSQWHGGYLAPFGYRPNGFGTDLDPVIDYGRFEDVENANTPAAIGEKISEIRNNPEKALLIPSQFGALCELTVPAERLKLEFLFTFPYRRPAAHPMSVRQPLCSYIGNNYKTEVEPTPATFDYGLWINKDAANP